MAKWISTCPLRKPEINSQARVERGSPFLVAKDLGSLNLFRQG
jgi:hypothetical protein